MDWAKTLENAIYFLAILNPASKVLFLSTYEPALDNKSIRELSWKSSLTALGMLIFFAFLGQIVLRDIFRIDLYSLRITGGLVLFFIGWTAVREGRFFQKKENQMREDFNELSIVPLAAPLIVGPGSITIAISFTAEYGSLSTVLAMTMALLINYILMLFSPAINHLLVRLHLTGPLIRITGLIVAAVAIQMILAGAAEWLTAVHFLKEGASGATLR